MAEIVYSKVGEIKCKAKSLRYTGSFMGVSQLSVDIVSPVPVNLEIGDYIVFSYDGIRYTIVDLPQVQKQSSSGSTGDAFIYNDIVFKSPIGLLAHIDYLDTVLNENNVHYSTLPVFTFYGTVKDFADRLQANINRIYPSGWKVSVEGYDDTSNTNYDILHEYNEISISNIKCLDSLSIPYDTWGITYVFMVDDEGNNCIVFNHSLDSTSAKKYGKGNGLYSLTKRMSTEKAIITRLRAYGGTDNLPARYYNNLDGIDKGIYLPNLMIPRSKWKNQNDPITAYIDSTDIDVNDTAMSKYGIREESVFFDGSGDNKNIEPTIKGITAGMIRAAKAEAGDTDNVPLESDYPDDERMDKILSCDVPDDNGLTREGEKLYSTTIDFNVIKGEDIIQPTYSTTANESDAFRKFSFSADVETDLVINTPAIYRINDSNNNIGNNPIISIADSKFGSITWNGSVRSGYMDYAKMDVITIDNDGRETVCAEGIELSWEVNTHVIDGQNRTLLDIFFAGGAANDVPAYFSIQNKGTVKFRIQISGACYFSTGAFAKLRAQRYSIPMIASMGALIQSKTFRVYIKQIGFNIEDYASAEEAKLVINSGACAGRSFNIKKNSVAEYFRYNGPGQIHTQIGWVFECFRSLDESIDQYFPNNIFPIEEGDEFVLTGLEMPDLYVRVAEQRLYDEAVELLRKRKDGLEVYELDIDNKVAYLDKVTIKEGMLIPLYDSDLKIGTKTDDNINYDYRIIDSVTIEIGEEPIPIIKAVLREEKEESVFKTLNRKLNTVASRTTQNVIKTQIVRVAEEVVRSNTPAYSPSAPEQDTSDFVTLSTEQTISGKKTFAEDVVFGADGGKMFIPSETPGEWAMYVDPSEAIDGEEPQPGGGGGGLDEDELWAELGGNAQDKVIGLPHLPDIPVSNVSGLLDESSRILPSLLPDYLLGQLLYGGTISASSVATVSAAFKDRYGVSASVLIISEANAALYEGVYFIASADGASGIMSSLDARTGDWIVSNGEQWVKIDNTDAVSSVAGLTGVISKAALQSALADSTHRFVTDAQISGWNAKWKWDEEEIKSVKVDNAAHADSAGSVPLSGIENMGSGWLSALSKTKPTTISGYGITDAYTKTQVNEALKAFVTLSTEQEITGLKTFASLCTLAGGALVSGYLTIGAAAVNEDYPLYVDGDAWIGSCLGVTEGIDCQGYIAAGVLHIPSADGNRLYSLSVDPAGAVSGEDPDPIDEDALWAILQDTGTERISKSHLPSDVVYTEDIQDLGGGAVWYGQISSGGAVTKRGGTATLRVTHTTTGKYTVSGLTAANVAAVTPMYVASGSISPVQKAYSAVIVRSMASLTVHMFDENGDEADYGFYLIAM